MNFGTEKDGLQAFFRWAFYAFIVLFPFLMYQEFLFEGTSSRAINLYIFIEVLAIICGFALFNNKKRLSLLLSPVTIALAVLLLVMFVSSIAGVDFHTSFWSKATRTTGLFYFIHMALFYLFFWMVFSETNRLRQFLRVFIVSAGIFSVAALLSGEGLGILFVGKPSSGFTLGNSTFAGMYLYAAFMLAVYYVASQPAGQHRWWKNLLPLLLIVNPYIINTDVWKGNVDVLHNPIAVIGSAQASSFTLFFSIGALFVIWAVSKLRNASIRRYLLIGSVVITLAVIGIGTRSLLTVGGRVQEAYLKQSSAARPIIWQFSKQAIQDRPLLGWGVDNFDRAYQKYYDSRLLEQKNGGEGWFDRAHNIIVDQTIETGYVGLVAYILVYLTLFGCLLYVLIRSKKREDLIFAGVLLVYFFGHILELQTAFDTTISYVPLAIMAVATGSMFMRVRAEIKQRNPAVLPSWFQYTAGAVCIAVGIIMFFGGSSRILRAEAANGTIRRAGSSEKRLPEYRVLFSGPMDEGAFLWRTSSDIQRGISLDPSTINDPKQKEGFTKEFDMLIGAYRDYLSRNENDYRIQLNLADTYIYTRLFGVDHLEEAHATLDKAVALAPQAPQAYWMQAVAYLYQHKFDQAKLWAQKAYDLNPDIEESQRLRTYINESIKTFPVIDLYSFKQI